MNKWIKIKDIKTIKTISSLKDLADILTEAAKIYTKLELQRLQHMANVLNTIAVLNNEKSRECK